LHALGVAGESGGVDLSVVSEVGTHLPRAKKQARRRQGEDAAVAGGEQGHLQDWVGSNVHQVKMLILGFVHHGRVLRGGGVVRAYLQCAVGQDVEDAPVVILFEAGSVFGQHSLAVQESLHIGSEEESLTGESRPYTLVQIRDACYQTQDHERRVQVVLYLGTQDLQAGRTVCMAACITSKIFCFLL